MSSQKQLAQLRSYLDAKSATQGYVIEKKFNELKIEDNDTKIKNGNDWFQLRNKNLTASEVGKCIQTK